MISFAPTLRSRLRALLAGVAGAGVLAVAAACNGDSTSARDLPGGPFSLSAGYVLSTINGSALPVEMRRDSAGRVVLTEGHLQLDNTTFSQQLTLVDTPPNGLGVPRQSVAQGTITVSGAKIQFRSSDGAEWEGTVSPGWIVYTISGNSGPITFAFKQG